MDYKYIEQLLDRYFEGNTTLEEESILHTFFAQKEIPEGLARYKALFDYEQAEKAEHLGADFDARILSAIGESDTADHHETKVVRMQHVSLGRRLRPLFRAAAAVAIVTLLGTAAQYRFEQSDTPSGWDYNRSAYKDSYNDPQKAYEEGIKALKMFKEGAPTAVNDSTQQTDDLASQPAATEKQ